MRYQLWAYRRLVGCYATIAQARAAGSYYRRPYWYVYDAVERRMLG